VQAQKNGELAASQRDALQSQLKDTEASAERAQKNGELAASERDALQARLQDTEAKARETEKNAELAASQRDALQAQLKDADAKAKQAQRNGELAANQREALQAQMTDTQAGVQEAEKIAALAQGQPNTVIGSTGDSTPNPVASNSNLKIESAPRDDQTSDSSAATSVRASSESKKGRHAIKHRMAFRRQNGDGSLRVIGRWLRRHLPLAFD
jgi:chromosome segregation ATPase